MEFTTRRNALRATASMSIGKRFAVLHADTKPSLPPHMTMRSANAARELTETAFHRYQIQSKSFAPTPPSEYTPGPPWHRRTTQSSSLKTTASSQPAKSSNMLRFQAMIRKFAQNCAIRRLPARASTSSSNERRLFGSGPIARTRQAQPRSGVCYRNAACTRLRSKMATRAGTLLWCTAHRTGTTKWGQRGAQQAK